jgi:Leucine-rich repeat (LRR) protein
MPKISPNQEIATKIFANCGALILSFLGESKAPVSRQFKLSQSIADLDLLNAIKGRLVPIFENLNIKFTFQAIDLKQNVDALSTQISTVFSNLHKRIKSDLGFAHYQRITKQYGKRDIARYNEIGLTYNNMAEGLCILAKALRAQIPTIAIDNPNLIKQWFTIDANLEALKGILILDLSKTDLKSLPREIGALSNLQRLDLSNNQIDHLPQELLDLEHLFICDLSHNYFSHNNPIIKALNREIFRIGSQKKRPLPTLPQATSNGGGGGGGSK